MKIRLKMTNGVLNVDANVKNEFKQHVLKDSAIQQGLDLDVIMQYVLYGAVDNSLVGLQFSYVAPIVVTYDAATAKFHVYEMKFRDSAAHGAYLTECQFNGNDTLFTTRDEAEAYCNERNMERKRAMANKAYDSANMSIKAFDNADEPAEATQPADDKHQTLDDMPDSYMDIVSAILDSVSKMQNQQETKTEKTPAKRSLADTVRINHIQERLAFCEENVNRLKNELKAKQIELDNWLAEVKRYTAQADQILKKPTDDFRNVY